MATYTETLSGFRDCLLPAVWSANKGKRVLDVDVRADFVTDELILIVRHRLCSRYEMENRMFHLIGDRINEALLVPKPTGKDQRTLRRQLHWRGKQATQAKPRRRS